MLYFCTFITWLKSKTNLHVWQIEATIVAFVLLSAAYISNKGMIELLGVGAVFFSWMHASVANSLQDAQLARLERLEEVEVSCYQWLARYFYIKEILWCLYFFYLGAWSALAGVFIFLLYQSWRKVWWKYSNTITTT